MSLSPTACVILGALQERPRSGYDIRRFANEATGPFWSVAESQLYPELRRLLDRGLVEGEERPVGERRRTIHSLTPAGRDALRAWVVQPGTADLETRDEMLVRLLFSDCAGPEERADLLDRIRRRHSVMAEGLRRLHTTLGPDEHLMHREVLRLGIELHAWLAEWYGGLEERLRGAGSPRSSPEVPA